MRGVFAIARISQEKATPKDERGSRERSKCQEGRSIDMIDKEAPILAFDASKGSSHCQGYLSFGKPSSKPIKVAHSRSGMAAAEKVSGTLERKTGSVVRHRFLLAKRQIKLRFRQIVFKKRAVRGPFLVPTRPATA
jgi:hypothetical protein